MTLKRILLLLSLPTLLLAGCGPDPRPAPSFLPKATATPRALSSPTRPSATPAPSPSPLPTETPRPMTPLGLAWRWVWTADDIVEAFAAADWDGDGRPEYALASYDRRVYLLDADGSTLWDVDVGGAAFALAVADLDGDGRKEILAGGDGGAVYALDADGSVRWKAPLAGRVTALTWADLRGDGQMEILAGARPGGVFVLAADGALLWQQPALGAPTSFLVLGGIEERVVLAGTEDGAVQAFDGAGVPLWQRGGGGYVRSLVPYSGQVLAGARDGTLRRYNLDGEPSLDTTLGGSVTSLSAWDLDGDEVQEALLGLGGAENAVVALEHDGRERWRTPTEHGVWALAMADLEGDGQKELVAGTDGGEILVLDRYGRLRGRTWVPWRVHGLLATDADGDGREEVLARASHHLYLLGGSLPGDEGERQRYVETLARWPEEAPLIPAGGDQVVLVAVGDICPGRAVEERMLVYGPTYPLEAFAPLLRQADIATGNLEGTLADLGAPLRKTYTFRAKPGLVAGLAEAGFDVLSLANNHAADFGPEGLQEMMAVLDRAGIRHLGAGPQAYAPLLVETKGLRIAFLARTAAIAPQEGVAWAEENELRQAVAAARAQADLVVVHLHAGIEYSPTADATQRALAQAAAEGGAALVIGHHAHAPQEVEWLGTTLVAYGLGDFVFDIDDYDIARDGAVLRVLLSRQGVDAAEWIPTRIVDDVQPRPLPGEDGRPLTIVLYTSD